MPRRILRALTAALALSTLVVAPLVAPITASAPQAAAEPTGAIVIGADAGVPTTTLFGDRVAVTFSASNETTTNAYNLAFRAFLPAGTPVGSVATASENMPAPTVTTLQDGRVMAVWTNVADLVAGATVALDVTFLAPPAFTIGDDVLVDLAAAASTNPRNLAAFTAAGAPDLDGETGANTASGTTELAAFEVTKSEPSAEAELLRGVQDHATVYTLTVRNNLETPTSGVSIVDHLPAGLEFLGCGVVDASPADTEEYPGAGRIPTITADRFANPCVTPTSVTTVEVDPDGAAGPLSFGVYTRVEWSTATLAAAGVPTTLQARSEVRIDYAAAVPLRQNAMPAPEVSTANLGNNTGALTTDEQSLVNHVAVTGTTLGAARTVTTTHEVVAEDVSIHKSVQQATSQQGASSTWTLLVESSEYATATGEITVVDTIPTSLDFTGSATPHTVEVVDGHEVVTWVLPGFADRNGTQTISYTTTTRTDYLGAGPVSAADSWTNDVTLSTTATVITANDGSTSQLEIVDASAAGQTTGLVTLSKDVANAPAAGATLDCSAVADADWSSQTATGAFTVGDRVCWRITAVFPAELDTLDVVVTDFLPAGFTYAAGDATYPGTVQPGAQPTVDGQTITWNLGTVDAAATSRTFVAIIPTTVTDATARQSGDLTSNLAKLSYRNTSGDVLQLRDDATAVFQAPSLTIDKSLVPGASSTVRGGDVVPYRVTVANPSAVPVEDVAVTDVLPAGIAPADVTNPGTATVSTNGAGRTVLAWPLFTLAAGATATFDYSVTVPSTFAPSAALRNVATLDRFVVVSNQGTETPYTPGTTSDETVRIVAPTVVKSQTTSIAEAGNAAANQATIGETVSYVVTATIPAGTTLPAGSLRDTLPTGLQITGAPTATLNGGALPQGWQLTTSGQLVSITRDAPYLNAAGSGDDVLEVRISARVTDVAGNAHGVNRSNTAQLLWNGGGTVSSNTTRVTIVEPQVTIAKVVEGGAQRVQPGESIAYIVSVGNAAGRSVAHQVRVVDQMPVDITPTDANGAPVTEDQQLPNGGMWDQESRTIAWTFDTVQPGQRIDLRIPAVVSDPLTSGSSLRNVASVTSSTTPTGTPGRETGSTVSAGSNVSVNAPQISLTKSVDLPQATIGQSLAYTVDVTIPASTQSYDVTVVDQLPAGIAFDGLVSSSIPVTTIEGANGQVAFVIGDVTAQPVERVVRIVYAAHVTDDLSSGDVVANSAVVRSNLEDRVQGTPTTVPTSSDVVTEPARAQTTIVEPVLSIAKDVARGDAWVAERRAVPGEQLTYRIVVSNTGTSPAYDVSITDDVVVAGSLGEYAIAGVDGATLVDGDPSDGSLEWFVAGPIPAGGSVTLTYAFTVPAGWDEEQEVDGAEIVNTAAAGGFGLPEATREAEPERTYPAYDAGEDVVEVELDLASIGDTLWYDVDGDGAIDAGEPRLAGVPVTVTYLGADGVLGGGDDESRTVTTDANGVYLVEHLPGGAYVVSVDRSAQAIAGSGLVPTSDGPGQSGAADGVWIGSLGEDEARRDVDLAFRGLGSLGDLVWFDQDRDGVQDVGEAGIPDVDVRVTWLGPDGTGAPVVQVVTTDDAGRWRLGALPWGVYDVRVVPGDSLGSYQQVSAVSNDELDLTSSATLSATAPSNLDQDFGFAGAGSIGDRIWLDQDGDGVQDAGEPGLVGVTVELTFTGRTGEVSTFTTTTGDDGIYGFANLPAGDYVVRVTGALPAGVTNSFDPDAAAGEDGDSVASGSLGAGQTLATIDFGYRADVLLGDRVWLDLDGDGVQGPAEPGLEGVTVTATGPNGLVFTTTTDADGDYLFTEVVEGIWTVTIGEGLPDGVTPTADFDGTGTPGVSIVELGAAGSLLQDFGYRGSASVGDLVWLDLDGDGVQGSGEPGLAGVTVTLTIVREGLEDVVLTTTTDALGAYAFTGLPAGTVTIAVDAATLPPGVTWTHDLDEDADGTTTLDLATGDARTDVDFGVRGSASLGDLVWLDQDGDGEQGDAEHGLGGVTVALEWEGVDGVLDSADDVTFTTTTDADGAYGFANLPAGDYRVRVDASTLPGGLAATFDEDGGRDGASLAVLEEGDEHTTADFGYRGAGVVGDLVWLDLDGDGAQGDREPGVPGQQVELTWLGRDGASGGDDLVFTTTTDANGAYRFEGLPDGAYVVRVVDGVTGTATNVTDPDGDGDSIAGFVLDGEVRERLDLDFGYQGAGALGDTIWWDDDADGIDEDGEPRLVGVSTTVTWFGPDGERGTADDVVLPTLPTDADGRYLLTGLPTGTYAVEVGEGIPAGLAPTVDAGDKVDPDGSSIVTLDGGTGLERLDQDFGYAGSGIIGDLVWLDLDGDGVRDAGEPGLEGVVVTIVWAGPDGVAGTEDDRSWTTTVADDGSYEVGGLPAGSFQVSLAGVPAGLVASADPDGGELGSLVELEPGEQDLGQDFGFVGDASVGDTIWLDVDGDGVQGEREPGVGGVTVTVTLPGVDGISGTDDDLVVEVETDALGQYGVGGLPAGPVVVGYDATTLPGGTAPSSDLDGGDATEAFAPVGSGEARDDVDFAVVGTQMLSGVVWVDEDGDGVRDAGEPGIPDVTVIVVWEGPLGPIELTVVTDADGAWTLPNVPAGDWTVRVDLDTVPPHLVGSTPAAVVVQVPVDGTGSVEHGLVPTGEVGDTVFHDEDRDGVQDAGEAGIGGVTVRLVDAQGRVVAETVTDADGRYLFEDVAPGEYVVRIDLSTVPEGYEVTQGGAELAVVVGPGESVLTADFPLALPVVVAPAPVPLPQTGVELPLALLGGALLLLLAGALLVRRRRS
ncbi:SdrD B-like domain-containing protein [Agrococcus jejuensis]|uniref:SdrD B-like domain-containing protein n=1 Tax=Agrococcus jejuensis TaxID=399736 RepID=UPI0011A18A42|nr:SdrD B-like domain-containing protein [Agrococcus jejuensis]